MKVFARDGHIDFAGDSADATKDDDPEHGRSGSSFVGR